MQFMCSSCGACCRRIGLISKTLLDEMGFPYGTDASGRCEMLGDDNKCKVYEDRPEICRIDRVRKKYAKNTPIKQYYMATAEICNDWINADKMPKEYLLNTNIYAHDYGK